MIPIRIEEIGGTDIEPTGGLSQVDILVAYMEDIDTLGELKKMEAAASLSEMSTITVNHVFKTGKGFTKFKAMQDKNGLESSLIGDQKGVFENKLTVMVQGSDESTLGALRMFKGKKPLIILAREAGSGRYRQLGHKAYPATMDEASPKVAPEYEGDNNVTFVFKDKNVVSAPIYKGDITMYTKVVNRD
jgi:hypothetical protein